MLNPSCRNRKSRAGWLNWADEAGFLERAEAGGGDLARLVVLSFNLENTVWDGVLEIACRTVFVQFGSQGAPCQTVFTRLEITLELG
jgi:hypothetical protein